jgi:lipopolysaccharide export system permease protein
MSPSSAGSIPTPAIATKGCGSNSNQALSAPRSVGEFNQFGKRMTLRIDRSEANGTRLMGIFTRSMTSLGRGLPRRRPRTVPVDRRPGHDHFPPEERAAGQDSKDFAAPRTLSFSYDLPINLPSIDPFRGRGNEMKELVLPELVARAYGGKQPTNRTIWPPGPISTSAWSRWR